MSTLIALSRCGVCAIGFFILATVAPGAHAQTTIVATDIGTITRYTAGWGDDQVLVSTTAPAVANGCNDSDGYITNPNTPGNHAFQAALLAAFLSGKHVQLVLQGCWNDRPQIIGVNVTN
jgi:hypothetical protein